MGAAGESGTAWPEVNYLGPQHLVLGWIADTVLYRVASGEAPALAAAVSSPVICISGVWANTLGEPIASAWLAATLENDMVNFEDMFAALRRAGVADGMVNPGWSGDLDDLAGSLPRIVTSATAHTQNLLDDQVARVRERLEATTLRLSQWQVEANRVADAMAPGAHQVSRRENIARTSRRVSALLEENKPAASPLIRVVCALVPRN